MEKQFVTYEIALKLKELGFDEPCFAHFSNNKYHDLIHNCENVMDGDFCVEQDSSNLLVPLWQQAITFLKGKGVLVTECWDGWEYGKDGYDFDYTTTIDLAILKAIELCKNN